MSREKDSSLLFEGQVRRLHRQYASEDYLTQRRVCGLSAFLVLGRAIMNGEFACLTRLERACMEIQRNRKAVVYEEQEIDRNQSRQFAGELMHLIQRSRAMAVDWSPGFYPLDCLANALRHGDLFFALEMDEHLEQVEIDFYYAEAENWLHAALPREYNQPSPVVHFFTDCPSH